MTTRVIRPRHLVLDIRALSSQRDGISTYILGIVPRLISIARNWELTIVVNRSAAERLELQSWGAKIVISNSRPMWPGQNVRVPQLIRRLRPDVFFYPVHDPPAFPVGCPLVMTIHDLTPLQIRPYFESLDRMKRSYIRGVTSAAIRRADRVIAVSAATFTAIRELFGKAAAEKTRVIHNGVEAPSAKPRVGPTNAHFIYLGTDRPHKNVLKLIDGYAIARRLRPDIPPLLLVGGFRNRSAVSDHIRHVGIAPFADVVGHVADEVAERLLQEAIALVMPSLAEGFGMPILEAMARGVPVITSGRSACNEVAGDAAVLVDPSSPQAIGEAIVAVAGDERLRAALTKRGLARAGSFSWERSAELTLQEIESAAKISTW